MAGSTGRLVNETCKPLAPYVAPSHAALPIPPILKEAYIFVAMQFGNDIIGTMTDQASRGTRPRGRPPKKPGEPKRTSFNTRLRQSLRQYLEAAATQNGRSLSEEIEYRLEQSTRNDVALSNLRQNVLPKIKAFEAGGDNSDLTPVERFENSFSAMAVLFKVIVETFVGNIVSPDQVLEEANSFKEAMQKPKVGDKVD